jgi:hypothetical protein
VTHARQGCAARPGVGLDKPWPDRSVLDPLAHVDLPGTAEVQAFTIPGQRRTCLTCICIDSWPEVGETVRGRLRGHNRRSSLWGSETLIRRAVFVRVGSFLLSAVPGGRSLGFGGIEVEHGVEGSPVGLPSFVCGDRVITFWTCNGPPALPCPETGGPFLGAWRHRMVMVGTDRIEVERQLRDGELCCPDHHPDTLTTKPRPQPPAGLPHPRDTSPSKTSPSSSFSASGNTSVDPVASTLCGGTGRPV